MTILIKALAGSHLFGTNTPESDTDYKGVYLPNRKEILLGNYKETRQYTTGQENSKNNVLIEIKEDNIMDERIELAEKVIYYVMKFNLRMACVTARQYLSKFKEDK